MRINISRVLVFISFLIGFACSQPKEAKEAHLGTVRLNVTGSPKAVEYFEEGLLLLHSFQYEDAREQFVLARKADPNMAMAYWGEALTHNHPIWREQDYDAAKLIIDSLAILDSDISELEEGFISAMLELYTPDLEKDVRDENHLKAMKKLTETFPESEDAQAFYALALMGAVSDGRDAEMYAEAAIAAKSVIEKNPDHPGALHYYIHACDDPVNAPNAIKEAYAYARVAPDAAHALHMPSHIFSAMGLWDELIESNIAAFQASENRRARKNLGNDALDYHSLHWLEYGYLQRGEIDSAEAIVRRMESYTKANPSKRARYHLSFQQSTFLAETGDYTHPIADIEIDVSDANITPRSQQDYVIGVGAFQRGDKAALMEAIESIEKACRLEALFLDTADFKICADLNRSMPRQIDIDLSFVMATQLRAFAATLEGDELAAEQHMRKAIELSDVLDYSFGPPVIRKPAPELYADWLLEKGRYAEAATFYSRTLEKAPGRRLSLDGLQRINAQIAAL